MNDLHIVTFNHNQILCAMKHKLSHNCIKLPVTDEMILKH